MKKGRSFSREQTYRFLGVGFLIPANRLSGWGSSGLSGRGLNCFRAVAPSTDLLASGRSMTLNEGAGGLSTSSNALPEDFRRVKPLGSLIGIETSSVGR